MTRTREISPLQHLLLQSWPLGPPPCFLSFVSCANGLCQWMVMLVSMSTTLIPTEVLNNYWIDYHLQEVN